MFTAITQQIDFSGAAAAISETVGMVSIRLHKHGPMFSKLAELLSELKVSVVLYGALRNAFCSCVIPFRTKRSILMHLIARTSKPRFTYLFTMRC